MATTILQTTLSVSINEQVSVNGRVYGNNISKTFDGQGKVDQRVMEISSEVYTSIFDWKASLPDEKGTGVKSEFTYFRITNTDDSIGVIVSYQLNTATDVFSVFLPAGCSHLIMSNDADATASSGAPVMQDISGVLAKSEPDGPAATAVYIEYVAVFSGGVEPPLT